ncbi:hypothetical protein [Paenibacillus tundrae]
MSEFIIEYELEKIKNPNTRGYLKEVISCYNTGNYRATIVTLYSVVIYDVLQKILELNNIYNSTEAQEIIDDIEKSRKKNERSPEWEEMIMNRVTEHCNDNKHDEKKKYLNFFDSHTYGKYIRLRSDRHKCAHPAYDSNHELRNFNRDDARVHLRNMFEHIFLKETVVFSNFIELIENDISYYGEKVSYQNSDNNITNYFNRKYFINFSDAATKQTFKYLFNYMLNNEQSNNRRILAMNLLLDLIKHQRDLCLDFYRENMKSIALNFNYSGEKISFRDYGESLLEHLGNNISKIIYLFFEYPEFYYILDDYEKIKFNIKCEENINYYFVSYFIESEKNINEHLIKSKKLLSRLNDGNKQNYIGDYPKIKPYSILKMHEKFNSSELNNFIVENVVKYSDDYDYSIEVLKEILPHTIDKFNKETLKELISIISENNDYTGLGGRNQFGKSFRSLYDYLEQYVEIIIKKLGKEFDYEEYGNHELMEYLNRKKELYFHAN